MPHKKSVRHTHSVTLSISIPIARRSVGDYQSGSSSGLDSSLSCAFPYLFGTVTLCSIARPYSGGTAPAFHRSSLLSRMTPDLQYVITYILPCPLFFCQNVYLMLFLMVFKSSMSIFFRILRNCSSCCSTSDDSFGKSGLISRRAFSTI